MTICGRRSFGFLFYFGFSIFVCCAAISSCRKSGFNVILIVQNYGKSIHEIVREEWEKMGNGENLNARMYVDVAALIEIDERQTILCSLDG